MSTINALAWAAELQQAVINIGNAASVGDIAADVEALERVSNLLLWGQDTDGDGTVEPEEGAVFTAYQHAQYTGAIGVMAGNLAAVVDPEPVADEVLVATNAGDRNRRAEQRSLGLAAHAAARHHLRKQRTRCGWVTMPASSTTATSRPPSRPRPTPTPPPQQRRAIASGVGPSIADSAS